MASINTEGRDAINRVSTEQNDRIFNPAEGDKTALWGGLKKIVVRIFKPREAVKPAEGAVKWRKMTEKIDAGQTEDPAARYMRTKTARLHSRKKNAKTLQLRRDLRQRHKEAQGFDAQLKVADEAYRLKQYNLAAKFYSKTGIEMFKVLLDKKGLERYFFGLKVGRISQKLIELARAYPNNKFIMKCCAEFHSKGWSRLMLHEEIKEAKRVVNKRHDLLQKVKSAEDVEAAIRQEYSSADTFKAKIDIADIAGELKKYHLTAEYHIDITRDCLSLLKSAKTFEKEKLLWSVTLNSLAKIYYNLKQMIKNNPQNEALKNCYQRVLDMINECGNEDINKLLKEFLIQAYKMDPKDIEFYTPKPD